MQRRPFKIGAFGLPTRCAFFWEASLSVQLHLTMFLWTTQAAPHPDVYQFHLFRDQDRFYWMGSDVTEVEQHLLPSKAGAKVFSLMHKELTQYLERITQIFPAIEAARPGCVSGIQTLCALNVAIEKAKLLLQHCSESSKLYLAITQEAIQLRFQRATKALILNLMKIQDMVPQPLAAQISAIVNDLHDAKFVIDSSEEDAGRLVLSLLRHDKSNTDSRVLPESEAFQMAALQLHITSPRAILIEKRSIKKLLEKVCDTDQRKEDILKYLLFLLRKYGNSASCEQAENADAQCKGSLPNMDSACKSSQIEKTGESIMPGQNRNSAYSEAQADGCSAEMAPEEFKCPISSRLMLDPVVIASGQTYERLCIEKWFSDGHDRCPRTQMKLSNFSMTPNTCVKDLISKWCSEHGVNNRNPHAQLIPSVLSSWNNSYSSSISSFGSSFNSVPTLPSDSHTSDYTNQSDISNISVASFDLDSSHVYSSGSLNNVRAPIFSWYHDSDNNQQFAHFGQEMYLEFFSKLASLPLDIQAKAIEDFKIFLKANDEACDSMHSNGFMDVLMKYLMDARDLSNVEAQRTGAQVLLAFASNIRKGTPPLHDESFELLASFIESDISNEVLTIMQVLAEHQSNRSKIMTSAALPKLIKILDSKSNEVLVPVVKILLDLSYDTDFRLHILSTAFIEKLVQLLGCGEVAGNCVRILENVCETEEARVAIFGTNGCIESIAELLDTGTQDEQEHAVAILLSICSYSSDYCQLVMNEGVIPSLVSISINGTSRGKESARKLLQLLRDLRRKDALDNFHPPPAPCSELSQDSDSSCKEKQPAPKGSSFFRRKLNIFTKHRSFVLALDRR